ncbi:MAG TPA: 50S ribosomal protein L13 [Anaerolineaceae bacterium]
MDKTYVPKGNTQSEWLLVDANNQNLGRVATEVARYLMGKHKPIYTPGADAGDYVIVVNAQKITVTGKRLDEKFYYRHSGYPGGIKAVSLRDQLRNHPDRVIRSAVWGMLPHNKWGRSLLKKLKIYAGNEHPHAAQNPKLVA